MLKGRGVKRSILIIFVVALALSWGYLAGWVDSGVEQPIAFPHKAHVALKLPCTGCHQRAEKDLVAGRPPTALCMACHAAGDSKSAEITKVKSYGEKGQEIPWQRVWRLPAHVFFSHRVHITVAKLECQTCHGPMETLDRPPVRPLKALSMDDCIACHLKSVSTNRKADKSDATEVRVRRIVNDCNACHR
jgi:hypothetical protein